LIPIHRLNKYSTLKIFLFSYKPAKNRKIYKSRLQEKRNKKESNKMSEEFELENSEDSDEEELGELELDDEE
jgi:hypothetical protein